MRLALQYFERALLAFLRVYTQSFSKVSVDMLAVGGSIYEVTGTVERSEAIGGTLEQ